MKEEEILNAVKDIKGLTSMSVNERLHSSGLLNEFNAAFSKDKEKARFILQTIEVDRTYIDKVFN